MPIARMVRAVAVLVSTLIATQMWSVAYAHDVTNFKQNVGSIVEPPFRVVEDDGTGVAIVERGTHGTGQTSVMFHAAEGSATPGSDFTAVDSSITFESPVEQADALVPITDDVEVEPLESIALSLSDPTGGMVLAFPNTTTMTVIDDDGPSRVSFETAAYSVFETRPLLKLTVVRSGDASSAATVSFATADDSAIAGEDYSASSGEVTFDAGERLASISVVITDDDATESDETLILSLSSPDGAELLEPSVAQITIRDDETGAEDTTAPYTGFHQPLNSTTYDAKDLKEFLVFMQDDEEGSGMAKVEVALRKTLTSGKCAWLQGKDFERGPCDKVDWSRLKGEYFSDLAIFELRALLKPSTKARGIKYYTAFSRGTDNVGNVQTALDRGQNKNRFEVR